MNKIRKWLNKPKKEVENQLMKAPFTPERRHRTCHDVTVVMETLRSIPQRNLDRGSICQTRTDGADPNLILTTRLSMLRVLLQGDVAQEEEVSDVQRQQLCPEHLKSTTTTTTSAWSPQTVSPFPVWRSLTSEKVISNRMQMKLADTGSCAVINLGPAGSSATVTSTSSPGLSVQHFLKTRDDCFLAYSPHPAWGSRIPCSLPCSPVQGVRRWRSPPSSSSPHSGLSRLWVEAALQRSKNIQQTDSRPPPSCSLQVSQDGEERGVRIWLGETEEEGEVKEWKNEGREKDKKLNTVKTDGIRMSDTIIFRPKKECEEEEEKDSDPLCLDSLMSRYCMLTPCICFRCPSAPPYDAEVFSHSDDQKHSEGLSQLSHRMNVQRTDVQGKEGENEQSLTRDKAPQQSESSCLYPSLSQWRITADSQTKLTRKQHKELNAIYSQLDHNTIQSSFHSNNTCDHLQQLCEMISGGAGELQSVSSADLSFTLHRVLDCTTCRKRTDDPVEICSFCSKTLSVQVKKHLCRNCDQVFCSRCLCHFVSLLQIHRFNQTAAV